MKQFVLICALVLLYSVCYPQKNENLSLFQTIRHVEYFPEDPVDRDNVVDTIKMT